MVTDAFKWSQVELANLQDKKVRMDLLVKKVSLTLKRTSCLLNYFTVVRESMAKLLFWVVTSNEPHNISFYVTQ